MCQGSAPGLVPGCDALPACQHVAAWTPPCYELGMHSQDGMPLHDSSLRDRFTEAHIALEVTQVARRLAGAGAE